MRSNRRSFLQALGGGAALGAVISPASAATRSKPVLWTWRYPIDPDAPKLKPPIDVFDVMEQRIAYPHPEVYDAAKDQFTDNTFVQNQANHMYQAAAYAMKQGWSDDVITAAFLHDLGKAICYEKHTWFSAELLKPYVSEKVYWITRVHFDIGYAVHTDLSKVPPKMQNPFIENKRDRIGIDTEAMKRNPWYLEGTHVYEADNASHAPHERPKIMPELRKVLAKTFKLSKKGLAYDGAYCDELWKILIEPAWLS
jgi:hypothetical protein